MAIIGIETFEQVVLFTNRWLQLNFNGIVVSVAPQKNKMRVRHVC